MPDLMLSDGTRLWAMPDHESYYLNTSGPVLVDWVEDHELNEMHGGGPGTTGWLLEIAQSQGRQFPEPYRARIYKVKDGRVDRCGFYKSYPPQVADLINECMTALKNL